jgi:hypothetical protein
LIDVGAASEAAPLFDADATLEVGGTSIRGRVQIAKVLAARQQNSERRTLHALAGFDFETAADAASASGTLVLFAGNASPISRIPEALVRYQAGFRRNRDLWQISKLAVSVLETTEAVG